MRAFSQHGESAWGPCEASEGIRRTRRAAGGVIDVKVRAACCVSCPPFCTPPFFHPLPFFSAPHFAAELSRSGWWPLVTSVSGVPEGKASVSSLLAEVPCRNRARQAAVPRNGRNRREGLELTFPLNRGAGTAVSMCGGVEEQKETRYALYPASGGASPDMTRCPRSHPNLEDLIVAGEGHPTGYW